jgi:S1-C subfamily serine protease
MPANAPSDSARIPSSRLWPAIIAAAPAAIAVRGRCTTAAMMIIDQPSAHRTSANAGMSWKPNCHPTGVITKVGEHVIDGSESLVATIRGHRPGEQVQITYLRGGERETVTADLGSDEDNPAS